MMPASELREALVVPWVHGKHADLAGIVCAGRLDLDGLEVGGFDLTGARFPDGVSARATRFLGLSWWRDVAFGAPVDFSRAQFMNDARFEGCHFADQANFDTCEFRGISRFDRITAAQGFSMTSATCYGNCAFQESKIESEAHFDGTEWLGGLWCDGSMLPKNSTLTDTQVHGRLWIKRGKIGNAALTTEHFGMSFGLTYI